MRRQDVHRKGRLVTVRRGPRRAAPHPYARVVDPRVDRAVLADLVGQSTDVINPRQVANHQSDVATQCFRDGLAPLPTACVNQDAVPVG